MTRYKKFIGGLLGGVTGSSLVALASAVGWNLPESAAVAIAAGLAALGTLLAPAQPPGW